jgi:hypothetical protein
MEKGDWIKYGTNPRLSNYDIYGSHMISLSYNLKKAATYSYYFYDFYNESIRFVTMKEEKANKVISYKPSIPVLPFYPDSTVNKYKEILDHEASFNSKIMQIAASADTLYQTRAEGVPVSSSDISALLSDIAAVETEFARLQGSFTNKAFVNFMRSKIADTKTAVTKLQS